MSILDLLYELLNLTTPIVSDSYETALKSTCKCVLFTPSLETSARCLDPLWNLTTVEEGYTFVASEGAAKLPRISSTRSAWTPVQETIDVSFL